LRNTIATLVKVADKLDTGLSLKGLLSSGSSIGISISSVVLRHPGVGKVVVQI